MGSGKVFVVLGNNAQDLRDVQVVRTEKSSAQRQEVHNGSAPLLLVPSSIWCGGSETRSWPVFQTDGGLWRCSGAQTRTDSGCSGSFAPGCAADPVWTRCGSALTFPLCQKYLGCPEMKLSWQCLYLLKCEKFPLQHYNQCVNYFL